MSSESSSSSESDESSSRTQSTTSNPINGENGNRPMQTTSVQAEGLSNTLDAHAKEDTAPGPRYRRGRGRSFFKDSPIGKNACQVPGCDRSITNMKEYYRRYKICPYHMEINFLKVEGQKIRFCQQCGRFQLLSEFDGDKRSCRKRLAKHNSRRRKNDGDGVVASQANRTLDTKKGEDAQEKRTPYSSKKHAHALISNAITNVLDAMRVQGLDETPSANIVKVRALVALTELQQALEEMSSDQLQFTAAPRQSLPPETLMQTMSRVLQQRQVPVRPAMGPPMQPRGPPSAPAPSMDLYALASYLNATQSLRQTLPNHFSAGSPAFSQQMPQQPAVPQNLTSQIHSRDPTSSVAEPISDKLNMLLEYIQQASKK